MPSFTVPPLARLIEQLERLPGIGHKSAARLAFHLLSMPTAEAAALREAVSGVQYGYDTDLLIYTKSVDGTVMQSDATQLMQQLITCKDFGVFITSPR